MTMFGLACVAYATLTPVEYIEITKLVQVEAARNTPDEYGVAASVMNRVLDPLFDDSVIGVIHSPGQYAKPASTVDPKLLAKLSSPAGQLEVCSAIKDLKGRTDFKGQTQLYWRVPEEDPMFHKKGNFYHYHWQQ